MTTTTMPRTRPQLERAWQPGARELFEQAFGAPWHRGAGIPTALDVLQVDLRKVGGWQSPRYLPAAALLGGTERPLLWRRELRPDELRRQWCIAFDKHAQHLGVLSSLELGVGDPEHAVGDECSMLDTRRPGYWRVRCTYPPIEPEWPDPLGRSAEAPAAERWISTPTLELALELDFEPELLEAFTWPLHRRLLRPFGARCLKARQTLQAHAQAARLTMDGPAYAAAQDALRALKDVYAPILGGFLAKKANRARSPRLPWYRPDWRHAVIGKSRANLLRNMYAWRARGGVAIGAYHDAVYFASDELADELARRVGIRLDASLGGYKPGRLRPLNQLVRDRRLNWRSVTGRERG